MYGIVYQAGCRGELGGNKNILAVFRQCIHDTWTNIIDAEMDEYLDDGCDFNFPKIYLMQ
jgi:hypothetical protein